MKYARARQIDHDLSHLQIDNLDLDLPSWGAAQGVYSTYPTQEAFPRPCRLYTAPTRHRELYGTDQGSICSEDVDHQVVVIEGLPEVWKYVWNLELSKSGVLFVIILSIKSNLNQTYLLEFSQIRQCLPRQCLQMNKLNWSVSNRNRAFFFFVCSLGANEEKQSLHRRFFFVHIVRV